MKKFLLSLSALTMAIGLAACSANDEEKTDKNDTTKEAAASKVDVKKELVKFYMEIGNKVNAKDADLNSYMAKATKEDAAPEELPTVEDKTKASESAASVAAELNSIQVPSELSDQKADLEAALKDYSASYQVKADELKKDKPSLTAGDDLFAQGEEKLGKVFEGAKLFPPTLGKQVN
ncbi:hypothetical protein COJ85_12375 [Bacillus sp. AFS076308]|uniref:hypothetical protein n=1 Tax=Bacillus sp. AFS076308 TaxID=2033512 RepID=UPI000BF36134|nr:hypothetical protein [Bacillus sp. AFS076308]PFO04251.1 hypothetical protein COJ85_12375 [Bacillus sp. AFS076308]